MNALQDIAFFSSPNVWFVMLGMILLGIGSSAIGTFAFLRKRSLAGDAVAHAVLPGICLAFLLFDTRNLWVLLTGAFVTGWLSIMVTDAITRYSKLKPDTAIGIALSVFFGIGIVLLTYIQQTGNAGQSGLQNFLLGKAAAMSRSDISTMMFIDSIILVVIILFFKEFKILSFDPVFARSTGMPVRFLETILTTLTVLAVAAGIQAVGVVLMAAMLIAPPAAARFWTNDLRRMLILAVLFGIAGGVLGAVVSYSDNRMPTGPWVVTMSSLLVLGSLLFAPGRGIIPRWRIRHQYRIKVRRENVLKLLYHLEEASDPGKGFSPDDMLKRRALDPAELRRTLKELVGKELVNKNELGYLLSAAGRNEARRVVRIHRLWEMYLTEKMNIASDHVHDDAEAMEHIITPEMEDKLARLLNFPARDPHNKQIPWS